MAAKLYLSLEFYQPLNFKMDVIIFVVFSVHVEAKNKKINNNNLNEHLLQFLQLKIIKTMKVQVHLLAYKHQFTACPDTLCC